MGHWILQMDAGWMDRFPTLRGTLVFLLSDKLEDHCISSCQIEYFITTDMAVINICNDKINLKLLNISKNI